MACAKTELCIFDVPFPQVVVDHTCFEEIFPINSITDPKKPDIEFNIVGTNTEYLDLNDTLMSIEFQVKKSDNTDLPADAAVTPANFLFHSLFKDVILTLNTEIIEGGSSKYTIKAIIDSVLNYSHDTKKMSLGCIGYANDADVRKKLIEKSRLLTLCGSPQLDFFDQPKYLIPGVSVHLRFKMNTDVFMLKSDILKPVVYITQAKLLVRRVRVEPAVLIGHQLGLNTKFAHYPIQKTVVVSHTMATGAGNFYKEQIFGFERLPKFVLVAFQSNDQSNGTYASDSSKFKHLNVSSITLTRNTDFHETYIQDFDTNNYMTTYVTSIIRNMGQLNRNFNCGITFEDFKETYPFFTFVLAPDFDIHTTQLPVQGNMRLDIKFKTPLAKPSTVHIYGIFDSEIRINKNRTVLI